MLIAEPQPGVQYRFKAGAGLQAVLTARADTSTALNQPAHIIGVSDTNTHAAYIPPGKQYHAPTHMHANVQPGYGYLALGTMLRYAPL